MTDLITPREVLDHFATRTALPPLERVIQRGNDPETARYIFVFTDGRVADIGSADTLWSRARLKKVLGVRIQWTPAPAKPEAWDEWVSLLVRHGVDVEDTPSFADSVLSWLRTYVKRADGVSREEAAPDGAPFIEGDVLYVSAQELAKFVRREYSETVKLHQLYGALRELGFEQNAVNYTAKERRSSTSYYRAELATLEADVD